jgi:hypothetical protein
VGIETCKKEVLVYQSPTILSELGTVETFIRQQSANNTVTMSPLDTTGGHKIQNHVRYIYIYIFFFNLGNFYVVV